MKPPSEVTKARLFAVFQASGMDICEFTNVSLLELAKLQIAAVQDIEEGIAHLKEHIDLVLGADVEVLKVALDHHTIH